MVHEVPLNQAGPTVILNALNAAANDAARGSFKGLQFGVFGGRYWKLEGIAGYHSINSIYNAFNTQKIDNPDLDRSEAIYKVILLRNYGAKQTEKQGMLCRIFTALKSSLGSSSPALEEYRTRVAVIDSRAKAWIRGVTGVNSVDKAFALDRDGETSCYNIENELKDFAYKDFTSDGHRLEFYEQCMKLNNEELKLLYSYRKELQAFKLALEGRQGGEGLLNKINGILEMLNKKEEVVKRCLNAASENFTLALADRFKAERSGGATIVHVPQTSGTSRDDQLREATKQLSPPNLPKLLACQQALSRVQVGATGELRLQLAVKEALPLLKEASECLRMLQADPNVLNTISPFCRMQLLYKLLQCYTLLEHCKINAGTSMDCGVEGAGEVYRPLDEVTKEIFSELNKYYISIVPNPTAYALAKGMLPIPQIVIRMAYLDAIQTPAYQFEQIQEGLKAIDRFDPADALGRKERSALIQRLDGQFKKLEKTDLSEKEVDRVGNAIATKNTQISNEDLKDKSTKTTELAKKLKESLQKMQKTPPTDVGLGRHVIIGEGANGFFIQTETAYRNLGVNGYPSISLGRDGRIWINGSDEFSETQAQAALTLINAIAQSSPDIQKALEEFENATNNSYIQQLPETKKAQNDIIARQVFLRQVIAMEGNIPKPGQSLLDNIRAAALRKREQLFKIDNEPILEFDDKGNLIKTETK